MQFVRQITQDPNDVRSRIWLVYKCNCCGEEKWYPGKFGPNVTPVKQCPKCKVTDDTNNLEYLIKQKQSLEQQAQAINDQLQTVTMKLASLQESIEQKETVPK